VARGSSFQFKGLLTDVRQIGERLRVGAVLDGSVRASGQHLRVVTQLVGTRDGHQLWNARFDRQLDDVFAVQDEIARAVATALRVQLSGDAMAGMAQGTRDLEAYTLYLKGRHHWNRRTGLDLARGIEYYQEAIARDPAFPQAHAGLAEAYVTQGLYGLIRPDDVMPRARAAAEIAAAFPQARANAAAVLGCVSGIYDWRWTEASRHFAEATGGAVAPPSVRQWHAINHLVPLGRFQEAEHELSRARNADPLSLPISLSFGLARYFAHRFDEAIAALQATLELDRNFVAARVFLALALAEAGRKDEARRALALETGAAAHAEVVAAAGYVRARDGDREGARRALEALVALAGEGYVSPSLEAQVHAGLGDRAAALDALERAADLRAADLAWLVVRPVFRPLHAEPRFVHLIDRIGLSRPA
jgi:serine/threonine-protein kinase